MSGDTPLHIVMIGPGSSPHIVRLAQALATRGYRLDVVSEDKFAPFPPAPGVDFHTYPATGGFALKAAKAVPIIRRLRPDIIHSHAVNHGGYVAVASGLHPHVMTAWGSDLFIDPHRSARRRMETCLALRSADFVLASSPVMLDEVKRLACRSQRRELMLWGVDTDHFRRSEEQSALCRRRLGLPDDAEVVFSPRLLRPLYNQHFLIEAWCRIKAARPKGLLLVSRILADTAYEARLRERVDDLEIGDSIRWVDAFSYEDLPGAYNAADVLVSLPGTDSMPITLMEGLACERLVVACNHPSVRDWLEDGDAGKMVDPTNPSVIANAVIEMLSLPPERKAEIGRNGRRLVRDRADRETWLRRLEDVYATAVQIHGGHLRTLRNVLTV